MRYYYRKDWLNYRDEIIERDGGICIKCGRGSLEGAILQVHHKQYLSGKLPWEYPHDYCETLCKGCHAGQHGIIKPFTGWECVGYEDLGEISGECELCGTSIRHVFVVQHEKWPPMEVGEVCCDHLTDTCVATNHMGVLRSVEARQQRFVESTRWKYGEHGTCHIRQKGVNLEVEPVDCKFRLRVNDIQGRRRLSSIQDAKRLAFELLENGALEAFLEKRKHN